MKTISFGPATISKKSLAIVMFGPPTEVSGFRPAEFYQVTIDPSYVSPTGVYIRFGMNKGDEITGWQRIEALTICEILATYQDDQEIQIPLTSGEIEMKMIHHPETD